MRLISISTVHWHLRGKIECLQIPKPYIECLIPNLAPKRLWIFLASCCPCENPTERVLHLLFHRASVAIRARRAGLQRRHKYQSMVNTEPPPCFISSAVLACFAWLLCQRCSQATGTPKAEPFVSMDCMLPPRFSLLFGCIINSARWTMQEDKGKKQRPPSNMDQVSRWCQLGSCPNHSLCIMYVEAKHVKAM